MILEILIEKQSVYNEVDKATAYAGAVSVDASGDSLYDRITSTEYDRELLDTYWFEACNSVSVALRQFVVDMPMNPLKYDLKLNMPSNYVAAYNDSIKNDVFYYILNSILERWYARVSPTNAEQCAMSAAKCIAEITSKIYVRKCPGRIKPCDD